MNEDKNKSVLIVDDEQDLCRTIARLLESRGYRVTAAENGKAALQILQDGLAPDLTVLDVMMPEMDGYETLAAMQARGLSVPVIMLTAKSTSADIMKGYRVGADYYITKPFQNATLLNIVDYLIGDLSDAEKEKLEHLL